MHRMLLKQWRASRAHQQSLLLGLAAIAAAVTVTVPTVLLGSAVATASASGTQSDPATDGPVEAPITGLLAASGKGYWEVAQDGQNFNFTAPFYGSLAGRPLNKPIVGMAATRTGGGYWMVASDGGIFAFGNASFLGSMGGKPLNEPIVGIAADPATGGYWMVASDGGIFSFTAPFYGSMGGRPLNAPIVGMAATRTGGGYWMVASDGGIFAFGNASFLGSMGGKPLNEPIVGIAADPATGGYWMVASDGGIFSFTAPFYGSMGGRHLPGPIVSITSVSTGSGYWLATSSGAMFAFGAASVVGTVSHLSHPYLISPGTATATGSSPAATGDIPPRNPPANIAPVPDYYLASATSPCWSTQGSVLTPSPTTAGCLAAELEATDGARSAEGVGPVQLPANFTSLTPAEQLFVVANVERVSRGLSPIVGLSPTLSTIASEAAQAQTDPVPADPGGASWWGSTWAGGVLNALDANYTWMYQDGWGGAGPTYNVACTGPTASGCWGHRDIILTTQPGTLIMGAGYAPDGSLASLTELFVAVPASAIPSLSYTWADAVAAGAVA